jgi:uncharacterized protein (DUF2147 family)
MFRLLSIFFLSLLLLSASDNYQPKPDDIIGKWETKKKDGLIEFFKKDGKYFGKISTINNDKKDLLDINNTNPNLRNRKILGLTIFTNFEFSPKDKIWAGGKVYVYKFGRYYDCELSLTSKNTMEAKAFFKTSFINHTEVFTRKI